MKILHLASTFFPRHTGGKEVFIYQLIAGTPQLQHLVLYHEGIRTEHSEYKGIPVRILPEPAAKDSYQAYWSLLFDGLPGFRETLDEFKPDLVHFHDFCAGASLSHLRICRQAGVKTLVTYHAPGSSCMQKGLIRENRIPCDGAIIDNRCTVCRYAGKGLPKPLSRALASVHLPVDRRGRYLLRNSTEVFHRSFREFFDNVDAVQVHANWVRDLLILNKVPSDKIHMVGLGGHPNHKKTSRVPKSPDEPLKVVFLGRCVNIKGAHILVDAVRRLQDDTKVEVHFLGPYWDESEYGQRLRKQTEHDIRFVPPRLVPPAAIVEELAQMDVCVIPSLWPETGPLSVLDAFAAGVPVIGTDLAGIRERVQHGKNGLLFKWADSEDLARQIRHVLNNREVLDQLRLGIEPSFTFAEMATTMRDLYSKIIN